MPSEPGWGPSGPPQSRLLVLPSLHTQSPGAGLACGQGLMVLLAQHCSFCLFVCFFVFILFF